MHPSSPHAPARLKARAPFGSGTTTFTPKAAKGRRPVVADDPLAQLAKEIHGKIVHGSAASQAHVAADELTLRRPRRPSARRAGFRTPPASR